MEKLLNTKLLLICLFLCISCTKKDSFAQEITKGKILLNVIKDGKDYILYKPCDASILRYEFRNDTLINTTHQDGDYLSEIVKVEQVNINSLNILYRQFYPVNQSYNDTLVITKNDLIWQVNNEPYIEDEKKEFVSYIEQSCTECWSKEDCDQLKKQESVSHLRPIKNIDKWKGKYMYSHNAEEGRDWRDGQDYEVNISENKVYIQGAGYQYHFESECSITEENDTLIFYNCNLTAGSGKIADLKGSVLKLYKKGDKYYIKTEIIEDVNIETEFSVKKQ